MRCNAASLPRRRNRVADLNHALVVRRPVEPAKSNEQAGFDQHEEPRSPWTGRMACGGIAKWFKCLRKAFPTDDHLSPEFMTKVFRSFDRKRQQLRACDDKLKFDISRRPPQFVHPIIMLDVSHP